METINSTVAGVLALRVLAFSPGVRVYSPIWNAYMAASIALRGEDDKTFTAIVGICDMFRFDISKLVR